MIKKLLFVTACLIASSVLVAFSFADENDNGGYIASALSNTQNEIMQRINGSPLAALPVLVENAQDGRLTANFTYADEWLGMRLRGSLAFLSNETLQSYGIVADVSVPLIGVQTFDINAAVYFDAERLAFGSNILGPNFYGITFETFDEDLRAFACNMGETPLDFELWDTDIGFLAEYLDAMSRGSQFSQEDIARLILPYIELLNNFLLEAETEVSDAAIVVNGQNVNARAFSYEADFVALLTMFDEFLAVLETDMPYQDMLYRDIIREIEWLREDIQWLIDDMSDELYDVSAYVTFFVADDRIVRMNAGFHGTIDGFYAGVSLNYDFGLSATDTWTVSASMFDYWNGQWWDSTEVLFTWDYSVTGNRHVNTITFQPESSWHSAIFTSDWNTETGYFTFSLEDTFARRRSEEVRNEEYAAPSFSGNLLITEDGFTLDLGTFELGRGQTLSLVIVSSRGADIPQFDFINIDGWNRDLVDSWENIVTSLGNLW